MTYMKSSHFVKDCVKLQPVIIIQIQTRCTKKMQLSLSRSQLNEAEFCENENAIIIDDIYDRNF